MTVARKSKGPWASNVAGWTTDLLNDLDSPSSGDLERNLLHVEKQHLKGLFDEKEHAQPAAELVRGLVHARLAARAIVEHDPDSFCAHALRCMECYQRAWPLSFDALDPQAMRHPFADNRLFDLLKDYLPNLISQIESCQPRVGGSTWLVFQSLLTHFLKIRPPESQFETRASLLLYNPLARKGHVAPVQISIRHEGHFGFYLDPVAFGITVIDAGMIGSLKSAWKWCARAMREDRTTGAVPTVCLSPHLPPDVHLLSGESAGALFACGMFAGAQRVELNSLTSITAAFDSQGHKLLPVNGDTLDAKLDAARESGLRRVVLCSEQEQVERLIKRSEATGLMVDAAATLPQAFDKLIGDPLTEEVLELYSEGQVQDWQMCRDAENDPDFLKHYVPPKFTWLGGRRDSQPIGAQDEAEQLACLLGANQPLCLLGPAGSGKSVFTRRLVAFLSSREGWQRLFLGKPPLVVRWEHMWLNAASNFRQKLADVLQSHCAKPGDAERIVADAIRQGRVTIILDGVEQASDEHLRMLSEFLKTGDGKACRIVMTARKRPSFLLSKHEWQIARIEGFAAQQQREYLRGLFEEHPEELFANLDAVADLLPKPVVLAMIRWLAEQQAARPGTQRLCIDQLGDLHREAYRHFLIRQLRHILRVAYCGMEGAFGIRDALRAVHELLLDYLRVVDPTMGGTSGVNSEASVHERLLQLEAIPRVCKSKLKHIMPRSREIERTLENPTELANLLMIPAKLEVLTFFIQRANDACESFRSELAESAPATWQEARLSPFAQAEIKDLWQRVHTIAEFISLLMSGDSGSITHEEVGSLALQLQDFASIATNRHIRRLFRSECRLDHDAPYREIIDSAKEIAFRLSEIAEMWQTAERQT